MPVCVECNRVGKMIMDAFADNGKGGKKIIGGLCKKCVRKGIGKQHNEDTKQQDKGWRYGFEDFIAQSKAKKARP